MFQLERFGRTFFPVLLALVFLPTYLAVAATDSTADSCAAPSFDASSGIVADGPLSARQVPLVGWKSKGAGILVSETNAQIDGRDVPALKIVASSGAGAGEAWLEFPFDATDWNLLSFKARVTLSEKSPRRPFTFHIWTGGKAVPGAGAVIFGVYDALPDQENGWRDFAWDIRNCEPGGANPALVSKAPGLRISFNSSALAKGETSEIVIADMKIVKGAHVKFDEPERWKAWLKFIDEYEPDLSDSSKYLEPPEEGRIANPIQIAKDGKALAEIVVDLSEAIRIDNFFPTNTWNVELRTARGHETSVARLASRELAKWLKVVTDAEFPVLTAPSDRQNCKIFLGASYAKEIFADDIAALSAGGSTDGFAVREKNGNIYIFGTRPAGTMNGVFAFIENNTDLIWAFPAPDEGGTVYTKNRDLAIRWANALEKPVFIQRGWQGGENSWMRANRCNFFIRDPSIGGFFVHGGHYLSPQYYDFSVGLRRFNPMDARGQRTDCWDETRHHACLSDPEFLPHALESVPNVQELRYSMPFNCVIGMDDNANICLCELCAAPIKADDGRLLTLRHNYEEHSSAWFYQYLNKVDDAVQKECPGYMTSTFAYFFAKRKPPIKVNSTIVPWICAYWRNVRAEPVFSPRNKKWLDIYKEWIAHSSESYLYDYYGFLSGEPVAEVLQADLRMQRDIGFVRSSTEGFMGREYLGSGDERWCISRLYWNPDYDVEQLHRYFNRRAFREAAPWMDKFRGKIRQISLKERCFHLRSAIKNAGIADELRECLNEAVKAVKHPQAKILVEKTAADFDHFLSGEKRDREAPVLKDLLEKNVRIDYDVYMQAMSGTMPSSRWAAYSGGTNAFAANFAWTLMKGVSRDGDGNRVKRNLVAPGEAFSVPLPLGNGDGRLIEVRVRPSCGFFETAGYPEVRLAGNAAVDCEYTWKPADDGTFVCILRPPQGYAVYGLIFRMEERSRRWNGAYRVDVVGIDVYDDTDGMPLPINVALPLPDRKNPLALSGLSGESGEHPEALAKIVDARMKRLGKDGLEKFLEQALSRPGLTPEAIFQIQRPFVVTLAENGETDKALRLLEEMCQDLRIHASVRERYLANYALPALIAGSPNFGAAEALDLYRRHNGDGFAKANGWSCFMNGWEGRGAVKSIAGAFAKRGSYEDLAAVYDAWCDWDGDYLPIALRTDRMTCKITHLRACKNDKTKEILDKAIPEWKRLLERCAVEAGSAEQRGNALLRLLSEDWDSKTPEQRVDCINKVALDDFMENNVRFRATRYIVKAWTAGDGKTDWKSASEQLCKILASGDWSNLARTAYSRQSLGDLRLEALCLFVSDMMKDGQNDAARELLENGSFMLGYTAEMKLNGELPRGSPADVRNRYGKLLEMMKRCGAKLKAEKVVDELETLKF